MRFFFRPFLAPVAKHALRLAREPDYRKSCWLHTRFRNARPRQPAVVRHRGWTIHAPDVTSFLSGFESIFADQGYAFQADNPAPRILDCGANIGLSVLYFKTLYPRARITAFEADPQLFSVLKQNVHGNGLTDVELVCAAVWTQAGTLPFQPDGRDGGRISTVGPAKSTAPASPIEVPCVRLAERLAEPVDLLKMDIEGAEVPVLLDCAPNMAAVKAVAAEFHSFAGQTQDLGRVLTAMEQAGFRAFIESPPSPGQPLLHAPQPNDSSGMDAQWMVYFRR